jgi:hypothetical protein
MSPALVKSNAANGGCVVSQAPWRQMRMAGRRRWQFGKCEY